MPRRTRFRLAVFAVLLFAAIAVPAPAADDGAAPIATLATQAANDTRPPLEFAVQDDPEFLGHPERLDATMAEVRALGFTHVRLSAHWDQLTRAPRAGRRPNFAASSPGAYDQRRWLALDRAVRAADRHGLRVMIDAAFFAPIWATHGGVPYEVRPRNRIDAGDFADFAVALARRYSGRFAVHPHDRDPLPRVDVFTLLNEPNLAVFWTPQRRVLRGGRIVLESPHAYRRLIARAYAAVKRDRPETTVLVGALAAGQAWQPRARQAGIPAMRFLREMACVDTALRPLHTPECRGFRQVVGDGLAVHPYSLGHPPGFRPSGDRVDTLSMGNLDTLARLLRRLAGTGRIAPGLRDIYVTEFGYLTPGRPVRTTSEFRNLFPKVNPALQAVWGTQAHELAWRTPQVRMFAQFLVRDTSCALGSGLECVDWPSGFRYSDGQAKPALSALSGAILSHALPGGDAELWGRLGSDELRSSAVVEYQAGGAWHPVRFQDVLSFTGGGEDGIFDMRVRGLAGDDFRIGVR